ncbi:hypothetical protein RyT2_04530 [Pseudolactococcus yaeyamensis]
MPKYHGDEEYINRFKKSLGYAKDSRNIRISITGRSSAGIFGLIPFVTLISEMKNACIFNLSLEEDGFLIIQAKKLSGELLNQTLFIAHHELAETRIIKGSLEHQLIFTLKTGETLNFNLGTKIIGIPYQNENATYLIEMIEQKNKSNQKNDIFI